MEEIDGFGVSFGLRRTAEGVRVVIHGGSWSGQHSGFFFVPERDFAMTMLTNSDGGTQLRLDLFHDDWVLQRFAGLRNPPAVPTRLSPERLADNEGRYVNRRLDDMGNWAETAISVHGDDGALRGEVEQGTVTITWSNCAPRLTCVSLPWAATPINAASPRSEMVSVLAPGTVFAKRPPGMWPTRTWRSGTDPRRCRLAARRRGTTCSSCRNVRAPQMGPSWDYASGDGAASFCVSLSSPLRSRPVQIGRPRRPEGRASSFASVPTLSLDRGAPASQVAAWRGAYAGGIF